MKLFPLRNRATRPASIVPQVRVGVAHLTGPGKLLATGSQLIYETAGARQVRLDTEGLSEIVAYGEVSLSGEAMRVVDRARIALSWLSPNGCFMWGRLQNDGSDRALTRLLQFQAWEDRAWQMAVARDIVSRKCESIHAASRHYQRQGKSLSKGILEKVDAQKRACERAQTVDQLRGIEGYTSSIWFAQYAAYFSGEWKFTGRTRRPPKDPINALLSLGYMQLLRRVAARAESQGYEVALGALHEFRPGRASLACDIMEPLRIPVVDRWVVAACGQGIVSRSDFEPKSDGGVYLKREKLGGVLTRLEEHWHQGNFEQIVERELRDWTASVRNNVSHSTSRAATYLKSRVLRAADARQAEG